MTSLIGHTASHYRIIEKLGEGGMGVVYKAHDTELDRDVALKFLPHGLTADESEQARFMQEAKAASALNHPNICAIHTLGEHEGERFIDMEFVDGKTLREIVPVKKMQDAITYAIQIAEALQEAHTHGIVHRDIKAENIMVNSKNQVKVMDFGLAKLKGSLKLTKTSSTIGTLAYMAPEQIEGGEVDARSDIFSFGVVLFEMLTGHLPFRGEHEAAMMYAIVNQDPEPLQQYVPDAPSELLHILDRALEKDREDRYQTVHDMLIDLRRLRTQTSRVPHPRVTGPGTWASRDLESESHTTVTGRMRVAIQRIPLWTAIVGVILVAVAIVFVLVLSSRVVRFNAHATFRALEIPYNQISCSDLSRDGNWIAFGACDSATWSVYFVNATKGIPKQLETEPHYRIRSVDISPDGSEICYCCEMTNKPGRVQVISSSGGPTRKIAEPGWDGKWRPDGSRIGYINILGRSGREFRTVRPDGSDDRIEFTDSLFNIWGSFCFAWSPDGKSLAWLRSFSDYEEIVIRDLASQEEHQLTSNRKPIDEIAWSSNNQILFSSGKGGNWNIWTVPAKGGEAVPITRGTGPNTGMRISDDCQRLLFLETRKSNNIWTADVDGSHARQLTVDDREAISPSFSPDKKHIGFSMRSEDFQVVAGKIFIMQSDGTNRTQLPTGEGDYTNQRWSPDGKYMTYALWAPYDSGQVFLIETAIPGAPKRVGRGIGADWIDAQRFITIAPSPNVHSTLYAVDKSEPLNVSEDFMCDFPLPDGKHILVGDLTEAHAGWWLRDTTRSRSTRSEQLLSWEYYSSAWPSASLKYLLYLKSNGEVWRISLPGRQQQRLPAIFDGLNPFHMDLQLSSDDKLVVYLRRRENSRLVLVGNLFE